MLIEPQVESQARLLGTRLKWARELVEPNRASFARSLDLDHSTIRNIENGTRSPSVILLMQICHSLRISVEYLLRGELRGVDGELAALLLAHHPELAPPPELARGRPSKVGQQYNVQPSTKPESVYSAVGGN